MICVVVVCLFRHAMRSAVFCIVSFVMFIVDAIGDHRMEAYPSIGLVTVCMLTHRVSYLEHFPSICIVSDALTVVLSMCLLSVSLGSRVKPNPILGCVCMFSIVLLIYK